LHIQEPATAETESRAKFGNGIAVRHRGKAMILITAHSALGAVEHWVLRDKTFYKGFGQAVYIDCDHDIAVLAVPGSEYFVGEKMCNAPPRLPVAPSARPANNRTSSFLLQAQYFGKAHFPAQPDYAIGTKIKAVGHPDADNMDVPLRTFAQNEIFGSISPIYSDPAFETKSLEWQNAASIDFEPNTHFIFDNADPTGDPAASNIASNIGRGSCGSGVFNMCGELLGMINCGGNLTNNRPFLAAVKFPHLLEALDQAANLIK